jgi:hypothetical protein
MWGNRWTDRDTSTSTLKYFQKNRLLGEIVQALRKKCNSVTFLCKMGYRRETVVKNTIANQC